MSVNEKMTALADAIREKSGVTGKLTIDGMTSAVKAISSLIVASASGNPIVLNDSTDLRVQSLRLFGKTTQNGTPTPEAPVPLVSAGDGGDIRTLILPAVKSLEDDMLHGIPVTSGGNYTDETGQQWVCDEVDFTRGVYVQRVCSYTTTGKETILALTDTRWQVHLPKINLPIANGDGYYYVRNMCSHLASRKVYQIGLYENSFGVSMENMYFRLKAETTMAEITEFLGQGIDVKYTVDPIETPLPAEELAAYAEKYGVTGTVYGRTTQNGTPSPDTPVPLVSYADVCQSILASTPNGLPGIPVTSGGNYTDETGQQWVCDEVDFARGVYMQRVHRQIFNGSETWTDGSVSTGDKVRPFTALPVDIIMPPDAFSKSPAMCDSYVQKTPDETWYKAIGFAVNATNNRILFYDSTIMSIGSWKTRLAANPITCLFQLATPIETPMSAEELAAYAALHTNYPNTTLLNDGGAGMEVNYVADTKLYIDNKINAMAAAIVNA